MRARFPLAAAVAGALLSLAAPASTARAQNLGPQRQFLAVEPYYEYTRVNLGGAGTVNTNGYGGRLWINGAPFHFPLNSSIALFVTYSPDQNGAGAHTWHYGGQLDQFLARRPLGGVIDPFISIGAGAYRRSYTTPFLDGTVLRDATTRFALSPGGGVRIPIPNRFELRGDVKDLIVFNSRLPNEVTDKTRHNLLIQAGLGLTF